MARRSDARTTEEAARPAPLAPDRRPVEAQLADIDEERRLAIVGDATADAKLVSGDAQVLAYRLALAARVERYRRLRIDAGAPLPIDRDPTLGEPPAAEPSPGARRSEPAPARGSAVAPSRSRKAAAKAAARPGNRTSSPPPTRNPSARSTAPSTVPLPTTSTGPRLIGPVMHSRGARPAADTPTTSRTPTMTDHRPSPAPRSPAPPAAAAPIYCPSLDDALVAAGDAGHPLHKALTGSVAPTFADQVIDRMLATDDVRQRLPGVDAAGLRRVLLGAASGQLRIGGSRQVGFRPTPRPALNAAGSGPLAAVEDCARVDEILRSATRDPLRRQLADGGGVEVDRAVAEFWSLAPAREVFDSPAAARSYLVGVARRQVPASLFNR